MGGSGYPGWPVVPIVPDVALSRIVTMVPDVALSPIVALSRIVTMVPDVALATVVRALSRSVRTVRTSRLTPALGGFCPFYRKPPGRGAFSML
ncbi:MAG: hypothetical protein ACYTFK_11950 [Planctomycetota bacterium]